MNKKSIILFLCILFALPIPIAILGSGISCIWFLSSLLTGASFIEIIAALFGVIIGSTYVVTYVVSVVKTWKEQKVAIKTFFPVVHCLIAVLFLLSLIPLSGYIDQTAEYFGFTKQEFAVLEEADTYGGFHGDGIYYMILDCSDNREKALSIIKDWKKFPLSENLNILMYGRENELSFNDGFAKTAHFPNITNGYYWFEDRHSESKDSTDDSEIFERYSYNFSIAIYDCDTDKLYYFELDT